MEQEIWKDIEGYEGLYKISSFGNVFSVRWNRLMSLIISNGYRRVGLIKNKQNKKFFVARLVAKHFIPNIENKEYVDHIDRNPLNNHVSNLRWATIIENNGNKSNRKNSFSKYKGVSFHKLHKKWETKIQVNGRRKHLGYFTCEKEAALAYNKKAKEICGEFALLNDIE
jgi:hypothetical protein